MSAPGYTYGAVGRERRFDYRAARFHSGDGVAVTGGAGWWHQQFSREVLVRQSRQFMRDNGLYCGMISRAVRYIVGNGYSLQAKTSNKGWNARVEELWRQWWRSPEVSGLVTGVQTEQLLCRELLTCGDTALLKVEFGDGSYPRIRHVESEQIVCSDSQYRHGIETDTTGRVVRIWVAPWRGSEVLRASAEAFTPYDLLFAADLERPSAYRGVPPCQSVFPMIHRINDVCDSEAIAWQMLARMAVAVTRERGPEMAYDESIDGEKSDADGDLSTRLTELDYALIFHGEPGDEIKGIERNIPGKNFSESLTTFLRLLGSPLGMPLELLLLDWTRSNYSQSRAVLEQAYQTFRGWQQLLIQRFYERLYRWRVREWMAQGALAYRTRDAFAHTWITPTFPWIDQLKEAQAYGAKLDRGFTTLAHVCKAQSMEMDDVVGAREGEVRAAIARAQSIEADTGVTVPWAIFAGLDPSKGSDSTARKPQEATGE